MFIFHHISRFLFQFQFFGVLLYQQIGAATLLEEESRYDVTWLHVGENYTGLGSNHLGIFCHCGDQKSVISTWRTTYVEIKGAKDFALFEGRNGSEVVQQHKSHLSSWIPYTPWRHNQISLSAFETECIGITSSTSYKVELNIRKINYWRVIQMIIGALLFFTAPSVCRNSLFYYTSGISVGIFASILILFFVISRLIPKKSAAYSVILFGGSFTIYILQKFWFNIREVMMNYSTYIVGYAGLAAMVSFAVCYRYQPMTDPRSQNLIQWAFQLFGLLMVFFSSEFHEVSMALVIILLASYNVPALWVAKFRTFWRRRFPPKVRFLTEMEYLEQTNRETKKAIDELRKFCDSPDCKSWKYVSKLSNPVRFAKFVEGDSHLTDNEILKYNSDSMDTVLTDDNDEEMDVEITDDEN